MLLVPFRVPVNTGHDFGVGEANVAHFAQLTPEEARLQNNQRKAKLQNEGRGDRGARPSFRMATIM